MGWDKGNNFGKSKGALRREQAANKARQKIGGKLDGKGPGGRVEAKAAWYVRYRQNRKTFESEAAYAKRTGDKRPSSWW